MKISINNVKGDLPREGFEKLLSKMTFYDNLQQELDGYSFFIKIDNQIEIFCIFYMGENELTENLEGYFILFIPSSKFNTIPLNNIILEIVKNEKQINSSLKIIYIQLFSYCENLYFKLMSQHLTLPRNCILSSLLITKDILKISNECAFNSHNFTIQEANLNDADEIVKCLVKAYFNGTPVEQYKLIGKRKFQENIKNYYKNLLNSNRLILVAKTNNEFCGHISYELNVPEKGEALMIDVFVVEKYKRMQIDQLLISKSHKILMEKGFLKVHGTVDNSGDINQTFRVFNSLIKDAWKLNGLIYSVNP